MDPSPCFELMPSPLPKSISYAGAFERSMDSKKRVTVPADWLNAGVQEFHAIPSPTGEYLMIMPPVEFDAWEERIRASELPKDLQRKAIRAFYSQARAVSADSNGRILLPEEQCELLKLEGDVVLVGARSRFEIWNTERWAVVRAEENNSFRQVAELIGL